MCGGKIKVHHSHKRRLSFVKWLLRMYKSRFHQPTELPAVLKKWETLVYKSSKPNLIKFYGSEFLWAWVSLGHYSQRWNIFHMVADLIWWKCCWKLECIYPNKRYSHFYLQLFMKLEYFVNIFEYTKSSIIQIIAKKCIQQCNKLSIYALISYIFH